MSATSDLELVPTLDLQKELMSRFDHAVFHGYKNRPTEDSPYNHIKSWSMVGDPMMGVGLAGWIGSKCLSMVVEAETKANPDEL